VPIPDPFKNSLDIFGFESDEQDKPTQQYEGDAGQSFAHRLILLCQINWAIQKTGYCV
jgi:hypothetical protein